jgi:hypothetical protein
MSKQEIIESIDVLLEDIKNIKNVTWSGNFQCTYKFENPDKGGWWIKNFMKYIKSCKSYGKTATKRSFMKLVDKPLTSGYMCTFFAAVKDAGIVTATKEWNGKFTECVYTMGPNWEHYLNSNLKRSN